MPYVLRVQLDPALSDAEKDKLRPPAPLSGRRKSVRTQELPSARSSSAAMPCVSACVRLSSDPLPVLRSYVQTALILVRWVSPPRTTHCTAVVHPQPHTR